jgi:hypothetical protein
MFIGMGRSHFGGFDHCDDSFLKGTVGNGWKWMFPYPPSGWGYGPQSGEFAIEQREILIERAKGSTKIWTSPAKGVFFRKLERSESNLAVLNCQTHFGDHNKPDYTQHLQVLPHFHEHGGSSSAISVTKSSISTTDGVTRQRFISLDTSTSSVVTGRREAAVSRVTRHGQSGGVGNRGV